MAFNTVAVSKGLKNMVKMHVERVEEAKPVVRTVSRKNQNGDGNGEQSSVLVPTLSRKVIKMTACCVSFGTMMLIILYRLCCNRSLVVKLFQWSLFGRFHIRDLVFPRMLNLRRRSIANLDEFIILRNLHICMEPGWDYYEHGIPSVYIKDAKQKNHYLGPLTRAIVDRLDQRIVVHVDVPNIFAVHMVIPLSEIDNYGEGFQKSIVWKEINTNSTVLIGSGARLDEYATLVHHLGILADYVHQWRPAVEE